MDSEYRRAEQTREKQVRRMAQRQGLSLRKSRTHDPGADDYGGFIILRGDQIEAGADPFLFSLSLDDVARYLAGGEG